MNSSYTNTTTESKSLQKGFTFNGSLLGGINNSPVPSSHIFSKAKEFGADETKFSKKLDFLGNLLHNYNGLNGLKDDFAQMLYSSS